MSSRDARNMAGEIRAAGIAAKRALVATGASTVALLLPLPGDLARLAGGELFAIGKDKLAHAALFALLGWFWHAAARGRDARGASGLVLVVILIALVSWGGLIELLQGWSGWRSAEASDLLADGLGAAAGLALRARRL